MAMQHPVLYPVLSSDKEEISIADMTISRDHLQAHYGKAEVAKHFAVWSFTTSVLRTNADKRVFFSTTSTVAGWETVASFHRTKPQGAAQGFSLAKTP